MLSVDVAAVLFLGRIRTFPYPPLQLQGQHIMRLFAHPETCDAKRQFAAPVVREILSTLIITSDISSVPFPPPPPADQNTSLPSNPPPHIRAHRNSNRPRLPRPIPIQWDGNRAEPRANQRASRGAKDLIQRRSEGQDLKPVSGRQGPGVEEREESQEGDV